MVFENKKAILFDLDGTLIDSAPDLSYALNQTLSTFGYPTYGEETIHGWVGNGAQILVKRGLSGSVLVDEGLDERLVTKVLNHFLDAYARRVCVDTILYDNVKETIDILKYNSYRLTIVTNKPYRFIEPILEGLGLGGMFELCIGGDSLPSRKPDPLPLLHVCEQLGVQVKEALMVGDSKNDIFAAKAAGMDCVGVTYGYNYGEDISVYAPDAVVDDFGKLLSLLKDSV